MAAEHIGLMEKIQSLIKMRQGMMLTVDSPGKEGKAWEVRIINYRGQWNFFWRSGNVLELLLKEAIRDLESVDADHLLGDA